MDRNTRNRVVNPFSLGSRPLLQLQFSLQQSCNSWLCVYMYPKKLRKRHQCHDTFEPMFVNGCIKSLLKILFFLQLGFLLCNSLIFQFLHLRVLCCFWHFPRSLRLDLSLRCPLSHCALSSHYQIR